MQGAWLWISSSLNMLPNAHILCIALDANLLGSRCAVLKQAGFIVDSASPRMAEILLASRKFDLVVTSSMGDYEVNRIINLLDGAEVLVLEEFTRTTELLFRVDELVQSPRSGRKTG
jgi:hypothetical protein